MPAIKPVPVNFGKDAMDEMWRFVEESTEYWKSRTRKFREEKLVEYARLYKGTPLTDTRDTPWPGASNIEVQVVGTNVDQLLARVMAIYMTEPLWTAKIYGDIEKGKGSEQRAAVERFMSNVALDPAELDLYRVEEAWFAGTVRNGTGLVKFPWLYHVEKQYVHMVGMDENAYNLGASDLVRFDGPKPEVVPLNKMLLDTNYQKLEDMPYKAHIVTVSRRTLEDKKALKIFDDDDIDKILGSPDRSQSDKLQSWKERQQGLQETGSGFFSDEYDLYECWIRWQHNGNNYRICALHHPGTNVRLAAFYNFYPENMEPFEDAKLAYDDDTYYGYGFAEMLKSYQDEIGEMHRQRVNAKTLSNTTAFRVNKSSRLHSILQFYPGVLVPADEGEIERLETSNPLADSLDGENMTLALVKERTGLDPATGGTGGGIVNNKRGVYSAQGTFAVLQQQNNRTALRMSDMRSAHTRLGIKLMKMYSHFGIGGKLRKFGNDADVLKEAFENIKTGKLGISVRASTASMNKELEKQNDILLTSLLSQLYQQDAEILQSLSMPNTPPDIAAYYTDVLRAKHALYRNIVQNFGHENSVTLIPVPAVISQNRGIPNGPAPQQGPSGQQGNPQPAVRTSGGPANAQQTPDTGVIPDSSMAIPGRVPTG